MTELEKNNVMAFYKKYPAVAQTINECENEVDIFGYYEALTYPKSYFSYEVEQILGVVTTREMVDLAKEFINLIIDSTYDIDELTVPFEEVWVDLEMYFDSEFCCCAGEDKIEINPDPRFAEWERKYNSAHL